MNTFKNLTLVAVAAFAISGCAALQQVNPFSGMESPETPTEVLGYVEATRAAVARSATQALETGRIDVETAKEVDESLDEVNNLADNAAQLLAEGNKAGASNKLDTAQGILTRLEQILKENTDG